MAWRHGEHGRITNQSTLWKCPTCGTQNSGPLEGGCTTCKAGADAQAKQGPPPPVLKEGRPRGLLGYAAGLCLPEF